MNVRLLATLQWAGLVGGGAAWWGQHLVGFGATQAECSAGGTHWGIANDVWQGSLMGAAAAMIIAAQAAAVTVLLGTREMTYEAPPPLGRIRFFAIAATVANAIFLVIVLLDGFASIFDVACRQG